MTYQHLDFRGYRSPLTLPSMWDTTILGIPVTGNVRWSPSIFEWRTVTTTMFTLEPNYTSIQQNYTQQVFVHMYPISISSSIFDACHGHPSIVEHLKWQTGNSVDQSFWKGSLCWWLKSRRLPLEVGSWNPHHLQGFGIHSRCLFGISEPSTVSMSWLVQSTWCFCFSLSWSIHTWKNLAEMELATWNTPSNHWSILMDDNPTKPFLYRCFRK